MAQFEKSQKIVVISEGGYQNDPRDEGNYYMGHLIGTNWGISATTLAGFGGRNSRPGGIEKIKRGRGTKKFKKEKKKKIIKDNYWLKNHFDKLTNQSVATMLYDGAVNHGTNGMRFLVEKALNELGKPLSYYEVFTLKGIAHLNKINQKELFYALKNARAYKYKQSPKKEFLKGWLNRLDRIKYYSENNFSGIWPIALAIVGLSFLIFAI